MDLQIEPGPLMGAVTAISSKSELHRMLICAAFADKVSEITVTGSAYDGQNELPKDIQATIGCLKALGAEIFFSPGRIRVQPVSGEYTYDEIQLDCGESGSTFRFLLPVAAAVSGNVSFCGRGRLPERPITDLADALEAHGVQFSSRRLPFSIKGKPNGGIYEIPGNISSQYLTGLLLMLPLLNEMAEINLTTELVSSPYVDITAQVMEYFAVPVGRSGCIWRLKDNKIYSSPGTLQTGGDWSNMAAFLTASMLREENSIFCQALCLDSQQGDRRILPLLESFGAEILNTESGVKSRYSVLHGTTIDIDETPDLLPVLAAAACAVQGKTSFINAGRLRLKESDRIESVARMIRDLGGHVETGEDYLTICGSGSLHGGTVDAANDHRIVMASAIAASICDEPVIIRGAEAVEKSYPGFFRDFESVKGVYHVI